MLNFDREDERLRQLVGADARSILALGGSSRADQFFLARERMVELAQEGTTQAALEADRLASYFGCAYGDKGLLARAGALSTLKERLTRLALLCPHLPEDAGGLARVRREIIILRTFAREHLARPPASRENLDAFESTSAAARVLGGYADYVGAALAIHQSKGGYRVSQALWAAADVSYLAADGILHRPLFALAGFALARVGDYLSSTSGDPAYQALCEAHTGVLRRELWEASEAQFARQAAPAPLSAIEQADYDLESLFARLERGALSNSARARLLAELYALVGTARCAFAAQLCDQALSATLALLWEGLESEASFDPGGPA